MMSVSDKFMKLAGKIASEAHLVAVRDAFVAMMPITMAGSVAVLLNVFLRDIPNNLGMSSFVESMSPVIAVNGNVWFGTIAIMALVFSFALGYNLSLMYKVNPLAGGMVSFGAFIATVPQSLKFASNLEGLSDKAIKILSGAGVAVESASKGVNLSSWGAISTAYAGATGLFTALIVGFISMKIFAYLMNHKVILRLPDSVPPAVNKAFAAIIPGVVAIYVAAILAQASVMLTGKALSDLISTYIQTPLMGLSQGVGSVILITFLVQLFWFFGIHGHNVLAPVMDGVYLTAQNLNLEHYQAHHQIAKLPYLWTRGSFDAYCQMGGSGVTLALIIAIFIFSKRDEYRAVAKLAWPMGMFNINEPVIFGIPIVLNPIFIIPWLIVPPICATIAYTLTALGVIPPVFIMVPWITPPRLYAYLATGGSWLAGLVSLLNLGVAFLIWLPFILYANRVKENEL